MVLVFTHMTGWPWAIAIIWSILAVASTADPAAMFAASLVPRAKTQQPLNPLWCQARATLKPFTWLGRVSTMDRPPEASSLRCLTPTSA